MLGNLAALVLIAVASQDGPVVPDRALETPEALRLREAAAYAHPLPRGAPTEDFPLVAWCEALVRGHVALGESLSTDDPLDADIIRLGKLEAADFRTALAASRDRQTEQARAAASASAAEAAAKWEPLNRLDEAGRSQAFGLFHGLPGRCEHAARRIREGIATPPATLEDMGIEEADLPTS